MRLQAGLSIQIFWLSRNSREKREEYDLEDPIDSDLSLPITPSVEETTVDPEEPKVQAAIRQKLEATRVENSRQSNNGSEPTDQE
jgi:hypothetical protein